MENNTMFQKIGHACLFSIFSLTSANLAAGLVHTLGEFEDFLVPYQVLDYSGFVAAGFNEGPFVDSVYNLDHDVSHSATNSAGLNVRSTDFTSPDVPASNNPGGDYYVVNAFGESTTIDFGTGVAAAAFNIALINQGGAGGGDGSCSIQGANDQFTCEIISGGTWTPPAAGGNDVGGLADILVELSDSSLVGYNGEVINGITDFDTFLGFGDFGLDILSITIIPNNSSDGDIFDDTAIALDSLLIPATNVPTNVPEPASLLLFSLGLLGLRFSRKTT
jgi:hypothetical protein